MTFTCAHCGEHSQGVAAVHDRKFMHHRCVGDYDRAKAIREKWEASGLLEGLTPMKGKINLATLYEGKTSQIISSE
jgi:hypothetical protein